MITKYKIASRYPKAEIEAVEVVRETDGSIFLPADPRWNKSGERREAKITDWHEYHDSWEQAHSALIRKAERDVESARRRLESSNGLLGNIKGMKPPAASMAKE